MEPDAPCPYEQAALKARAGFFGYSVLAVCAPLIAVGLCYFYGQPSTWIARGGAVMAGLAFLADLKARDMAEVFKPGGFVGNTFHDSLKKYRAQIFAFTKISTALVLFGTAVWGFGDLLPIGS